MFKYKNEQCIIPSKRGIAIRAQIAVEYLFILGFLLIIIAPILYYTLQGQSASINVSQAGDATTAIAQAVNTVHALGPGSRQLVWVTLPQTLVNSSLANKEVLLRIKVGDGVSDIVARTNAAMSGSLPSAPGTYQITVEALNTSIVRVSP
ncbi:hypothetical protein HY491_04795 [Candidatus Woesearchaeota archaeon]|nr:hypothetical protein [Candidatus Woesearchaeota archaeon]